MSSRSHLSISKFSIITQLSQKALRIYDKRGLLEPIIKDNFTGYRYYSLEQVEIGIKIKMLISMGFSLDEITSILDAASNKNVELISKLFKIRLRGIQFEIERLSKIEELMISNNPMELLYLNCTEPIIRDVNKIRVICKREKGTYAETIGKLIQELMQVISQNDDVKIVGPVIFISHDKSYKEKDADIEVAIPIVGRIMLENDDMEIRNIPAGKVVSLIYTGSYDQIGIGYSKIQEYISAHNLNSHGLFREMYLNSPGQVSPDELLTEIQVAIKE